MNKSITNKLPVADQPILIFIGYYYISVIITDFLLGNMILLKSQDLHSGSNTNSIYTDIIDLHRNLAPANNSTNNKSYNCPVWKRGEIYHQSQLFFSILFIILVVYSLSFFGYEHWCTVRCSLMFYCCCVVFY